MIKAITSIFMIGGTLALLLMLIVTALLLFGSTNAKRISK